MTCTTQAHILHRLVCHIMYNIQRETGTKRHWRCLPRTQWTFLCPSYSFWLKSTWKSVVRTENCYLTMINNQFDRAWRTLKRIMGKCCTIQVGKALRDPEWHSCNRRQRCFYKLLTQGCDISIKTFFLTLSLWGIICVDGFVTPWS
jgi:hypothetical protein